MLRTPLARRSQHQPSPLILAGSADDGDLSLATTLPSPPIGGTSGGSPVFERPSQLRRSSSHYSPSSGIISPGGGLGIVGHAGPSINGGAGPAAGASRKRKSTLTRVNDLPTTLLPVDYLARLNDWIETVVIVNFDLDRGPGALALTRLCLFTTDMV